jgi:hypothetical protein
MGEVTRKKRSHLAAAQWVAAKFAISDTLGEFRKSLQRRELPAEEVHWNRYFNLKYLVSRL